MLTNSLYKNGISQAGCPTDGVQVMKAMFIICNVYLVQHFMVMMCLQLYREVQKLLSSYPDLVGQFAAFLQPGQAVDCNCLMDNLLYTRADKCILALQVNFLNSVEC